MATVPTALAGRHFLKELDFTGEEFRGLVELAAELKAAKKAGTETRYLTGRNIALIFEKTSTRTRCAFEVAAADQGASTTYLDPSARRSGTRSRSGTPPASSAACSTRSSTGATVRRPSRNWPRTRASPSTTASPTTGTPPRCSPTCSP